MPSNLIVVDGAKKIYEENCFNQRDLRTIGFVLNELSRIKEASCRQLSSAATLDEKRNMNHVLSKLIDHGVLARTSNPRTLYMIVGNTNFFTLRHHKRVNVSSRGNRGVSIESDCVALKNGIREKLVGSTAWVKSLHTTKFIMHRPKRTWLSKRGPTGSAAFKLVKPKKNDRAYVMAFDPPLRVGERFSYKFYIWSEDYYGMSRGSALQKGGDEWVREGVGISDPTETLEMTVQFPKGFAYQKAILERNPIITTGGPNRPGKRMGEFALGQDRLHAKLHNPDVGQYFLSWIPHE